MKLRTLLIAAGIGLVSMLGLAPTATATPALPAHTSSAGRVACVAVHQADLGVCVGNPLNDLP